MQAVLGNVNDHASSVVTCTRHGILNDHGHDVHKDIEVGTQQQSSLAFSKD